MAERGRTLIGRQDLLRPTVKIGYALMIAVLVVVVIATLFPLVWVVLSSVKSSAEIFRVPPTIWPEKFQWGTYFNVWTKFNFSRYFKNTIVLTAGIWLVQMTVTTLAAYSLSKLKPPGYRLILFGFLAALMVPGLAMMIPKYVILKKLPIFGWNLLDSYWAFGCLQGQRFPHPTSEDIFRRDSRRFDRRCHHRRRIGAADLCPNRPAPFQAYSSYPHHLRILRGLERLYVALYCDHHHRKAAADGCHLQQRLQERCFCSERHYGGNHHRNPSAYCGILCPSAAYHPGHYPHRA